MKLLNFFFAFDVLCLAFSCEKEVVGTSAAFEVSLLEGASFSFCSLFRTRIPINI